MMKLTVVALTCSLLCRVPVVKGQEQKPELNGTLHVVACRRAPDSADAIYSLDSEILGRGHEGLEILQSRLEASSREVVLIVVDARLGKLFKEGAGGISLRKLKGRRILFTSLPDQGEMNVIFVREPRGKYVFESNGTIISQAKAVEELDRIALSGETLITVNEVPRDAGGPIRGRSFWEAKLTELLLAGKIKYQHVEY
ncbi:MAG TPA: hypothetical protein VGN12_14480 [Pirellulales bacterium]|jgi:hypothetical protein